MSDQEETPLSIGELMERDPLSMTDAQFDRVIETLRSQRAQYVARDDKKIGTPAARKSKAQLSREETTKLADNLDLDDLLSGL